MRATTYRRGVSKVRRRIGRSVLWKVKRMKPARIVALVTALAGGGTAALLGGRSDQTAAAGPRAGRSARNHRHPGRQRRPTRPIRSREQVRFGITTMTTAR